MKPLIVFKKEGGKLQDRGEFKVCFNSLNDGKYTIEKWKNKRSTKQNRYYWVLVTQIARETGDLHIYGIHLYLKNRYMVLTTTDMDTALMSEYIDSTKQWMLDELGIIPLDI